MPDPAALRSRSLLRSIACAAVLAAAAVRPSAAPRSAIPSTDEARQALRDVVLAPLFEAAAAPSRILEQSSGERVLFRVERQAGALYLEFTRGDLVPPRLASAGTFIIKRSAADGAFVQAKIFLQDDPGCFIRLAPLGSRTSMEVTLFGETYQRGVVLPAAFDTLLTTPLERIERLSAPAVDWSLLVPAAPTAADFALASIVERTRRTLPGMRYVDDGAMDAQGRWVTIRDGAPQAGSLRGFNCSGFAKWFVDGFVRPIGGALTDIAELKTRHEDIRGSSLTDRYEEERDPWFGLDWSRNLAAALARARGDRSGASLERFDVRGAAGFQYAEDAGYPVEQLQSILWVLERHSPGGIYLGSINRELSDDPPLPQHHHLVVVVPFIDAQRAFQVAVFESATETSVASLRQRFAGQYIHLVRLDALGRWDPPPIE